jgi:hypothetical protein
MYHLKKIIACEILLFITSGSFGQSHIDDYFSEKAYNVIKQEINGVEISIDPRIEFFQIINMVGGNPAINATEMNYKLNIISYFEKFRNHPALDFFRNNYRNYFSNIDAPYSLLLSLNNDFTFRQGLTDSLWQKHPAIDTLLKVMRTFIAETDFVAFFNSQERFYELMLQNTIFTLNDFNEKRLILDYFGIENSDKHKFFLILNSLGFGNFGKGVSLESSEEHYAIVSPVSGNGSIPSFEKYQIYAMIWHEFSHSFSNPLVDENWNYFSRLSYLYEPIAQSMAAQYYWNWRSAVYEHMVRAITCRLGAIKYSEEFAELNLNRIELGQKFIYTLPIISALKEYEKMRDYFPSLGSFMHNIKNALEAVNKEHIDNWLSIAESVRKPDITDIPSIGSLYNRDNRLLILSTYEEDTAAARRLKEFVLTTHPKFKVVDDTTALQMDLSSYNLFVIGTPWGNRFMEKYIGLLPVKITRNRLIAQNIYEGTGYAFMSGWINPFNPENVMVIYAAQHPDYLLNFTWIPRGSTDYHIVKDLITIKAADYKRYKEIWGCY